jgi:hypothetical protein
MNKKASIGIGILSALFIFIVGFATINLLMPEVTDFRTEMDCANAVNISDGSKVTCLVGGLVIPYFILLIISISIGGIISRFTF